MNILITGGTGLIGKAFIQQHSHQYQFTVLSRHANKQKMSGNVNFIESLAHFDNLDEFDAVINLQGEPIAAKRWSESRKQAITDSRIHVTQQLASLINDSANPPAVFISGSAIGFYGRQTVEHIDERFNAPTPEFSHTLCEKWEHAAHLCHKKTRVCVIRTGIVLSKHGGALSQMLPSFKFGLGAVMGDGKQFMSWIHINDMVAALDFVLHTNEISGPINFTAPNPVTNLCFSDELAHALNRPRFLSMPAGVVHLLFGELSDLLVYGQHVIPAKLSKYGYQFKLPQLRAALSDLFNQ